MKLKTLSLIAFSAMLAACGSDSDSTPTSKTPDTPQDLVIKSAFDVLDPKSSTQIYKYYSDSADGAMNGPSNYGAFAYGVDDSHNMWSNFTTYLFKDGSDENARYFKAQIVSNYGEDGTLASGNLYVRYSEVDSTNTGATAFTSLDSTTGAARLSLESGSTVNEEEEWQFSYQKYVGFKVNGGVSGTGNVSACVAHTPAGLYDATKKPVEGAFKALTKENTLAAFEAVNSDSCSEDDFKTDTLDSQIKVESWLSADYTQGAPIFSASTDTTNGWIIQSATQDTNENYDYGRVKVASVEYQAGVKRAITFSLENWDDNGHVFTTAQTSPELNFTTDRQYWDMETNSVVTAADDWELSIKVNGRSWDIQVNAAVSGAGSAGIGHVLVTP
jgi:hypothetical protein